MGSYSCSSRFALLRISFCLQFYLTVDVRAYFLPAPFLSLDRRPNTPSEHGLTEICSRAGHTFPSHPFCLFVSAYAYEETVAFVIFVSFGNLSAGQTLTPCFLRFTRNKHSSHQKPENLNLVPSIQNLRGDPGFVFYVLHGPTCSYIPYEAQSPKARAACPSKRCLCW